jgi:16S rRNA (uracil1498-N3)-methyltransferase
MPNFFVNKEYIKEDTVFIGGDDARHVSRSLRMAEGDTVTVSDGEGRQYIVRLTKIRDEGCEGAIESERLGFGESAVSVTLFMGYPKSDKLETIVQKATELGAVAIVPFEQQRCIKRPAAEKSEKITARLSRIAEEAAKQCSRSIIPSVSPAVKFSELVGRLADFDLALFCYECAPLESTVKRVLDSAEDDVKSIAVIVGCEGGFDPTEAETLIRAGAKAVSLGERILRCETAPDFILSTISYRFD